MYTVDRDYGNGGLGMVDLQYLYRRHRLGLYLFSNRQTLTMYQILKDSTDILTVFDSELPNKCWYKVFTAWRTVTQSRQIQNRTVKGLWFNNIIRVGKQTIYYNSHLVKNGVRFVNHLIKNNGCFLSLDELYGLYFVF